MYQAFEATIDQAGNIRLNESINLPTTRRALVIVLDDATEPQLDETALLSEESLAESWNRPEEDAAWAYLQSEK
jgi:hypothetical protein